MVVVIVGTSASASIPAGTSNTTTTLSIAQGHIKRHPEDIDAGVNEWKTSEWQTQISEDLKQIQDQEYPVEVEDAPEMGPLGLQPFSADEWTDLKEDTIEQWWGDAFIFQNSRVLLLGKPKIGKSNFLGAFAAGATTGTDFMGVPFSKPLKVIWFQAEIIKEFMKDRITTYFRRFGDDEDTIRQGYDNLIVSGRLRKNLMTDQDIEAFHQEIQFHKPDIVMIDPIINFFDGEENSNTEIRKLLDRIDKLIEPKVLRCWSIPGKERRMTSLMSAGWVSLRRMVRLRHQDVRQETQRVLLL